MNEHARASAATRDSHVLTVHATPDAAAFVAKVAPLIEAEPVLTSVVATNLHNALRDPSVFTDPCWLWAEGRHGEPVAVAMHTPPRFPHLATRDPAVGAAVADHLSASGRPVSGVGGNRPAAEAFAGRWKELRPCEVSTLREEGVYEAAAVTPPSGVRGSLRLAGAGDAPLLNSWALGFIKDIGDPVPDRDDLLTDRIGRGEMWVWEDDAAPVSMAYASPPAGGTSRISWVYTPPQQRRHGYASAVVAGATSAQLAAGHRCMLYTDLSNPTSNGIYQAIGYRRVGDGVMLSFDPEP